MTIKILRVIESAAPSKGGPIFGIVASNPVFNAKGAEVTVITADDSNADFFNLANRKNIVGLGPSYSSWSFSFNIIKWLFKNCNKDNFDIALLHGVWQWPCLVAAFFLRARGIPFYLMPHGSFNDWDITSNFRKRLKKKLYYFLLERFVTSGAKNILFTSEDEMQGSIRNFNLIAAKCKVVRYGVPDVLHEKKKDVIQSKSSYLLFLSRIHPKKGIEKLLAAYSLSSIRGKYRLYIAGTGEQSYQNMLTDQVKASGLSNDVVFLGHVDGVSKTELMTNASIFILPSYQENFGLAVAESLAVSTPVAVSKNVNIFKAVEKYRAGFVFDNEVSEIVFFLNDFEAMSLDEYKNMCKNSRDCFENEMKVDNFVCDILGLCGSVK